MGRQAPPRQQQNQSKPLSWRGGMGVNTAETTTPIMPTYAIATWCRADHCSTTTTIVVIIVIIVVSMTTIIATEDGRMGCMIVLRRDRHRHHTRPASRGASTGRAPNNQQLRRQARSRENQEVYGQSSASSFRSPHSLSIKTRMNLWLSSKIVSRDELEIRNKT